MYTINVIIILLLHALILASLPFAILLYSKKRYGHPNWVCAIVFGLLYLLGLLYLGRTGEIIAQGALRSIDIADFIATIVGIWVGTFLFCISVLKGYYSKNK